MWRFISITGIVLGAAVVGGVVFAQLGDTQTASGTVNVVTSSAADLYICEPGGIPGPECGADDSGADEAIFETDEDMKPGDTVQWDIRLKNVGEAEWAVQSVNVNIVEINDPGSDCGNVLFLGPSSKGLTTLGKDGDVINDNPLSPVEGFEPFASEPAVPHSRIIIVASGDYEDVRLRLVLDDNPVNLQDCSGNRWNVSWAFSVVPTTIE